MVSGYVRYCTLIIHTTSVQGSVLLGAIPPHFNPINLSAGCLATCIPRVFQVSHPPGTNDAWPAICYLLVMHAGTQRDVVCPTVCSAECVYWQATHDELALQTLCLQHCRFW